MNSFYNGKPCGCNSPSSGYYRVPNMTSNFKRQQCVSPEYADSINDLDNLLCGKFLPIRGGAHDRFKTYEDFTIVYDAETLVAYLSKKEVPYGVEITNREYWQPMNITGYADDNVIILTDRNVSGQIIPYTLETAVKTIAKVARKQGKVLSFFSLEGGAHWEIWQFFGLDVSDWEDVSQWRSITNVWNKFVGWYNTTEELYQLHVYPIDGKYAIVGPTIRDAVIYKGTPGGWIPLDINLYQKFLNDLLELIDEGVIVLTDCQKDILKEWFKEIGIGCDCDHGEGKNDWGWAGRPYTDFIVKAAFECDSDLKLTYPTSIYHDASDLESVGNPALHSITVDNEDMSSLNLHFTAGAWNDIMNGNSIYRTDDKDVEGFLDISFVNPPRNLQITVDDNVVKPFTNGWKVACDGHQHIITLLKPNACRITLNYYDSANNRIKTRTMEVPYGETMTEPTIDTTYTGHTFTGWATNNSITTDPDNGFNVVGKTPGKVPAYFDFDEAITSDLVLYAWYNVNATFQWSDNNGAHTEIRDVAYNTNVTNAPTTGVLTGYTFNGWRFNNAIIPAGQPIGPITLPVTINGVYEQNVVTYNYKMVNSTGHPITVTVGGQQITLAVGETKTVSLQGSENSRAVVNILTNVPTAANTNYAWTINSTEGNTKTVNSGTVTLGLNTSYNYKIVNNSNISPVSVTVDGQTKNVTTSNTFTVDSNSSTVTINTPATNGYRWVINNETGTTKDNVAPGNVYISLEVDPSVHRSEYNDSMTGGGAGFTWGINQSKYIAADFRDSDLQLAMSGRITFASDDILSADVTYSRGYAPIIRFYLEPPADYGGSPLTLDNEVTSQIVCTPDRARFLINSHLAVDNLQPTGGDFEFNDYYLPYTLDEYYSNQISYIELELFYNLDLSNLTAPAGHSLDEYNLVATVDGEYWYEWNPADFYGTGYNYLKEN